MVLGSLLLEVVPEPAGGGWRGWGAPGQQAIARLPVFRRDPGAGLIESTSGVMGDQRASAALVP